MKSKIKLSDYGEFRTSSIDKKSKDNEPSVFLLNYMDVYRNNKLTNNINFQKITAKPSQIEACSLKIGDILFTPSSETADDIGHVGVVLEDFQNVVFSYHLIRYRPIVKKLDPEFSSYLFQNPKIRRQFSLLAQGLTRFTLSIKEFNELIVEIPESLEEQKRIAKILTCVDNNIDITEQEIKKLEMIKEGILNLKISEISSKSDVVSLEDFCDKITDGTHDSPKQKSEKDKVFYVPFITSKNLLGKNGLDFNNITYITKQDHDNIKKRSFVGYGDILIGMIGTIGVPSLVNSKREFSSKNVGIIKNTNVLKQKWVYYIFNSNYFNQYLKQEQAGGILKFLSLSLIRKFPIPNISLEELQKMIPYFEVLENKIQILQEKKQKLEQLKKGLLNELL